MLCQEKSGNPVEQTTDALEQNTLLHLAVSHRLRLQQEANFLGIRKKVTIAISPRRHGEMVIASFEHCYICAF
jgi:hypothetical protein